MSTRAERLAKARAADDPIIRKAFMKWLQSAAFTPQTSLYDAYKQGRIDHANDLNRRISETWGGIISNEDHEDD